MTYSAVANSVKARRLREAMGRFTTAVAIVTTANTIPSLIKVAGSTRRALAMNVWHVGAAEIVNHQFDRVLLPSGHLGPDRHGGILGSVDSGRPEER